MDMHPGKVPMKQREKKGIERRQFKRVIASFSVVCKVHAPLAMSMNIGGKDVDAIALDVSEGGVAVLSNYDIPVGSIVMLKFIMFNEAAKIRAERSRMIEIQGEARYSVLTKEKSYRLGIRFMNISSEDRSFIAKFIETSGS